MASEQSAVDPERPFRLFCPKCGADSDAEDREFGFSIVTYVPHSAFMITEMHCETCGETFDNCHWPTDHESLARSMAAEGLSLDPEDEETLALLNRYLGLVETLTAAWGDLFAQEEPDGHFQRTLDLSQEYVAPDPRRLTAVHARVIAAARGLRKAVSLSPSLDRLPILLVGPFKCVLTLDKATGPIFPHTLHLSLSHALGLGDLADHEAAFLVSLFFSPEEAQQLTREEGHFGPFPHFRLACGLSEAAIC